MKKIILIAAMALLPLASQAQTSRNSCVAQVLKNDRNGVKAHVIFACGSETIAINDIAPFEQLDNETLASTKDQYMNVLKGLIANPSATCFQNESEIFWIGICHN